MFLLTGVLIKIGEVVRSDFI